MKIKQRLNKFLALVLSVMLVVGTTTTFASGQSVDDVPVEWIVVSTETTTPSALNYFDINTSDNVFAPTWFGNEDIQVASFAPNHIQIIEGGRASVIEMEVQVPDAKQIRMSHYDILHNGRTIHSDVFLSDMTQWENTDFATDTFSVYDISYVVEDFQADDSGEYSVIIHYIVNNADRTLSAGPISLYVTWHNEEDEEENSDESFYDEDNQIFYNEQHYDEFFDVSPFSTTISVPNPSSSLTHSQQLRNALTNSTAGRTIEITSDMNIGSWSPVELFGNAARFTINGNGHIINLTANTLDRGASFFYSGLIGIAGESGGIRPHITINDLGINQGSTNASTSLSRARNMRTGGIFGAVQNGNVTISRSFVVGGEIRAHRLSASATATSIAGGFFGYISDSIVIIEDSFANVSNVIARSAASGNNNVTGITGGLVGFSSNTTLTIRRSYMRGTTAAEASNSNIFASTTTRHGALVGRRESGGSVTANNNAFRIGSGGPSNPDFGSRLTDAQLRTQNMGNTAAWEFRGSRTSFISGIDNGNSGFPVLGRFYLPSLVAYSMSPTGNPMPAQSPAQTRTITASVSQPTRARLARTHSDGTNFPITASWSSSSSTVAAVSSAPQGFSGSISVDVVATPNAPGTATITPTVGGRPLNGFNLTVNPVPATGITFSSHTAHQGSSPNGDIPNGATIRLVKGSTSGSITASVETVLSHHNNDVEWLQPSNTNVTMSGTGNSRTITAGNNIGTTTISARPLRTPTQAATRSFNVSVHHIYPTNVTFNTAHLNTRRGIGQTFILSPETILPSTRTTDSLTWTISSGDRAILDFSTSGSGNSRTGTNVSLLGRSSGTARVTASIYNSFLDRDVTLGYVDIVVSPVTVTIDQSSPISLQVGGETRTLTATVSPAGMLQNVRWGISQSNPAGAVIVNNTSGTITPISAGNATITATLESALGSPSTVPNPSASIDVTVRTSFSGGSGTATNPWQISTFEDLNSVRHFPNAHFLQVRDITIPDSINFEPISPFNGIYDGGRRNPDNPNCFEGFKVIGLNIERNNDYVGLFGRIGSNGIIRNLGLENASISGRRYVGGIAGYTEGSIINCFNNAGTVFAQSNDSNVYVGGIVGMKEGSGAIDRCYSSGSVIAESGGAGNNFRTYAGGLVGKIENSGGTSNRTTVSNSYAKGTVSAQTVETQRTEVVAGGLIGAYRGHVIIHDCYTSDIFVKADSRGHGDTHVISGGLVGRNENYTQTGPGELFSSEIRNSYSTARIDANSVGANLANTYTGGLLGSEEVFTELGNRQIPTTRANVVTSYYLNTQIINTNSVYDNRINIGSALTTEQMKNVASFIGWNFSEGGDWYFDEHINSGFPILQGMFNGTYTPPTEIILNRNSITMSVGQAMRVVATALPERASIRAIDWVSDNENVAFVGISGTITARNPGRATITARSVYNSNIYASVSVTVFPQVATPNATLLNSNDADNLLVALHSDTPGAVIYYSINEPDTIPDRTSIRYTGPIPINVTSYVQARAFMTFDGAELGIFDGESSPAGFLYTVMQAASPAASHDSGILPFGTVVTFSGATQGATVRYTMTTATAASEPGEPNEVTPSSPILSSVRVDRSINIHAKAFHPTRFNSGTVMFSYQAQVDAPVFFPTGTEKLPFNAPVTMASMTPGATIRYTTDGSVPNESSAIYASPIMITMDNTTIRAMAFLDGCVPSEIISATFTLASPPPIEVDVDPSDIIASGSQIKISCPDTNIRNMVIRYTVDGSVPNASSPLAWRFAVGGGGVSMPIAITEPIIIRAQLFNAANGTPISDIREFAFDNIVIANPDANIVSGARIRFDDTITLSSITSDAQIRYTTDGSEPNENSTLYVSPIYFGETYLNQAVLIRAIAYKPGLAQSREVSFSYIVGGQVTFAPIAEVSIMPLVEDATDVPFKGNFVTLFSEPEARIHFTTNGDVPTRDSAVYSQPILVTSGNPTFTVSAIAVSDGKVPSEVMTFEYDVATLEARLQEETGPIEIDFDSCSLGPIRIPPGVPMLGDTDISIDFSKMGNISVIMDDERIRVGIGVSISDDDEFDRLKEMVNSGRSSSLFNARRLITPAPEPYFEAMGYLEGIIPGPGRDFALGGQIMIKLGVKYDYEQTFVIVVVPVVIGLTLDANAEFIGGARYVFADDGGWEFEAVLKAVMPHVEVRGGIGVAYICSVGAFGNAEMNVEWNILENDFHLGFEGSWGAYAKALFWEYRIPAMRGTFWCSRDSCTDCKNFNWAWKTGNEVSAFSADSPIVIHSDSFTLASRNYLSAQSSWMGGEPIVRPFSTDESPEIRTLQQSVYDQVAPQIAEAGGKRVMVFLADDGSRDDMNRTVLMYSVYDKTLDTWSIPRQVDNSGTSDTADFFPHISSDGGNIWVTWHNSRIEFSNEATMADMLANAEISVARFNGETFTDIVTLTDNNFMDTQPKIAVNGGNVTVTWVRNERSEIIGLTDMRVDSNENKLMAIQFANGVWGNEIVLRNNLGAVVDTAVGYFGNDVRIAYILDADNNFNTIHDRSLSVANINGNVISTPVTGNLVSNPTFTKISGTTVLSWYENIVTEENEVAIRGGNVRYMIPNGTVHALFDTNDMLTDNFRIINGNGQTAVIYPHIEDSAGSMFARIYDNGSWSTPFKLVDTEGFARHFDGVLDVDGNFYIAYNNSRMAVIGNGDNGLIESNDLNVVRTRPLPNIQLSSVFYSHEDVIPGEKLTVTAHIENIGGRRVDNVNVFVNGTDIGSLQINGGLQIGEFAELEFEIPIPIGMSEQTNFIITIVPTESFGFNMHNNSYTLTLGAPNMTLTLVRNLVDENDEDGAVIVTATVKNETVFPADVNLIVRRNALDGEILDIIQLGTLSTGQESATADFYIAPEVFVPKGEDFALLYVEVISSQQEEFIANTSNFVVINAPSDDGSVTITFDPNGGEFTATSHDVSIMSGNNAGILPRMPTAAVPNGISREGYRFTGWFEYEDGENVRRRDNFEATQDVTLVATWEIIPNDGEFRVGSVFGNGRVTSADATAIARWIIGQEVADFCHLASDMDGDGEITLTDLTLLARWLVGHDVYHLIAHHAIG